VLKRNDGNFVPGVVNLIEDPKAAYSYPKAVGVPRQLLRGRWSRFIHESGDLAADPAAGGARIYRGIFALSRSLGEKY
jgi:hypothetical protein